MTDRDSAAEARIRHQVVSIETLATAAAQQLRIATLTQHELIALFHSIAELAAHVSADLSADASIEPDAIGDRFGWPIDALRAVMQAGTDREDDLQTRVADLLPWARLGAEHVLSGAITVADRQTDVPVDQLQARSLLDRINCGGFDINQ